VIRLHPVLLQELPIPFAGRTQCIQFSASSIVKR
jgi:hypothetical protein